jgi:hypothetical protein
MGAEVLPEIVMAALTDQIKVQLAECARNGRGRRR